MISTNKFAEKHKLDLGQFNEFCVANSIGVSEYGRREIDEKQISEDDLVEQFLEYQRTKRKLEEEAAVLREKAPEAIKSMILTTGISVQDHRISQYLGLVSGECALGTGFLSTLGAGFADLIGTNSNAYSQKLREAKEVAEKGIKMEAALRGANAIIGVDIDYTTFSADIMGVICTGTAVKIEPINYN